jgi:hypothetical protein
MTRRDSTIGLPHHTVPRVRTKESQVRRTPVSSSTVASVGYNAANRTLEVEFTSGRVYRYFEVEKETHDGFLKAASKGTFFNAEIRGAYSFAQVR